MTSVVDILTREMTRKLGVTDARLTSNYQDVLNKVDCVVVVTPAQTHFPICKELLEAAHLDALDTVEILNKGIDSCQ